MMGFLPPTINEVEKFQSVLRSESDFFFKNSQIGLTGSFWMFERYNTMRFGVFFWFILNFSSRNRAISSFFSNSSSANSSEGKQTITTFLRFVAKERKNSYVFFVRPHCDATLINITTFSENDSKLTVFPQMVLDLKSKKPILISLSLSLSL